MRDGKPLRTGHNPGLLRYEPVKLWVYLITGFLQTRGSRSRMVGLWKEAHDRLLSPSIVVGLRSWNSDWESEAELVFRMSDPGARVVVFAYSYGAGWGFPRFARALGDRGVFVSKAVLSDPVHRHPLLIGRWRTFFPGAFPVRVPANVRSVESYAQRRNWPRAHRLVADGPNTKIKEPVSLEATHQTMDDHPSFIWRCLQIVENLQGEPAK